ncbi:hypothetical protein SAMN04488072_101450 [Lentibacillus halodurans]|uniref:Uncharacterized protein n=1 Tax=Lentibacillus halodurans TaxID=237679 RepID=A0A1I0VIC9_9BACI|nr:hypothetical protein SAMN04488072_101450 [Lentibacillus halodurans]
MMSVVRSYSQKIIAYHVILYGVYCFFNFLWNGIPGCLSVVYAYRDLFEHGLFFQVLVMGVGYSIYHHFPHDLCEIIMLQASNVECDINI